MVPNAGGGARGEVSDEYCVYLYIDQYTMKIVPVVRKALLKEIDEGHNFWSNLPGHVKVGIQRGQKQAAEGKLTPHDEVMKKYAKYL